MENKYSVNGSKPFSFIQGMKGALRSILTQLSSDHYEVLTVKQQDEAMEDINSLALSLGLDLTITNE